MGRIFKLVLIFSCIVAQSEGLAKPKSSLFIIPTVVLGEGSDAQEVRYGLPCGSLFKGWLLTGRAEIGAVVEQSMIACSSLPRVITEKVSISRLPVKPLKLDEAKRIRLIPAITVDWFQGKSKETELVTTFEGGCRPIVGGVFMHKDRNVLVAMAELTQADLDGRCVKGFKSRRFQIAKERGTQYRPFHTVAQTLSYKVVPGAVSGRLVRYQRQCNEAPVGLTVTTGELPMAIGVLLAQYKEYSCDLAEISDEFVVPSAVQIPDEGSVVGVPEAYSLQSFDLRPVFKVTKSLDRHNGKVISHCGKTTLVYTEDAYQNLAVGSIEPPSSQCRRQMTKTILPFIAQGSAAIVPLRVKLGA
jgi:hypothetical protein